MVGTCEKKCHRLSASMAKYMAAAGAIFHDGFNGLMIVVIPQIYHPSPF